jgi:hypothetical protein
MLATSFKAGKPAGCSSTFEFGVTAVAWRALVQSLAEPKAP